MPRCLNCTRAFRTAKGKSWKEQLCNYCYTMKYGGMIKGSYRKPGRLETSYGISRGCGYDGHQGTRPAIITPITKKNIKLYVKVISILLDKQLNPNLVLAGAQRKKKTRV